MSEVRNRLDRVAEDTLRAWAQFDKVEAIMEQCVPDLRATAYDTERGGTLLWCDYHERPVADCHKRQDDDGHQLTCEGVPLPKVVDPVGDDAVATRVYADAREATRRSKRMEADAAWFIGMCNRYQDADPTPAVVKELADKNTPKCERHLRFGYERDARSQSGSRVKRKDGTFVFTEAHKLCEFCEDFARDFGRLATQHEIEANVGGKRLRRPA